MTSTELAVRPAASLPEKIEYARFLAKSGLLPQSYRQHPENILYAYEYGELLGLHPMAAITGIHVIDGRPSISSGLMSALVRRAGHRIRVQGDGDHARCQIIRSDDPGFTYSATWTIERAKQAGLLSRTNWQHYPAAMLKARAVSECARDACQEVLLGMQYTPDELGGDDDGGPALVDDGFPAGRDGRIDLTQLSEEEKDAAGVMTRGQRVDHDQVRRMDQTEAGRVERLSEADENDPWASPAETASNEVAKQEVFPGAALDKIKAKHGAFEFTAEELADLIGWLAPDWPDRTSLRTVMTFLDDHLKAAQGDVEEARSAIWTQYRTATGGSDE